MRALIKSIFLRITLAILTVLEVYLCTAFLPAGWQAWINKTASYILPKVYDQYTVTHPALDWEIDQFLQRNGGLRFALYTFVVALLLGNTALLVWVWHLTRRTRGSGS